jgi:ribose/xylose/arabinose/galactoside ABC-type transport system permease subunit
MAVLARLLWEAVLLIGVVLVIGVTVLDEAGRRALTDGGMGPVGRLCVVGLLATGLSLSVRVGAPNLAVGSLASVGGAGYGWLVATTQLPMFLALVIVLAAAVAFGLLMAVAVAALRIPSWGVTLGVAVAVSIIGGGVFTNELKRVDGPDLGWWTLLLVVVLALGSVTVGALLWTNGAAGLAARAWRSADPGPAGGWNVSGAAVLVGGTVLSSVLAVSAGVMGVLNYQVTPVLSAIGADYLAWGLIPVLIAGASLRSPRGAVTGIVLASALVIYAPVMFAVRDAPSWLSSTAIVLLALVGLLVGRGLDAVAERMTGPAPQTGAPGTIPGIADTAGAVTEMSVESGRVAL